MKNRTRLKPDESAERLLSYAVTYACEHGIDRLNMSVLSATAGVSRGLIGYYFGTAEDLRRKTVHHARVQGMACVVSQADTHPVYKIKAN